MNVTSMHMLNNPTKNIERYKGDMIAPHWRHYLARGSSIWYFKISSLAEADILPQGDPNKFKDVNLI